MNVQSALVITYRLGVIKVNTLYFLRYFDIAYFKINKEKTTKSTLYSYFCIIWCYVHICSNQKLVIRHDWQTNFLNTQNECIRQYQAQYRIFDNVYLFEFRVCITIFDNSIFLFNFSACRLFFLFFAHFSKILRYKRVIFDRNKVAEE